VIAPRLKLLSSLLSRALITEMTNPKSIDKISKLLDLLDKHIKEENCRHSPNDLLREYEKLMTV
jgi:hypothetical protein